MAGNLYNVGIVARTIAREVFHNIRVENHRFIVLRRHK